MVTFLVVDDIDVNVYMLRVLLEGRGYEVLEASNGIEALQSARQQAPDIIVADILMPEMDGFALCREWKQDETLTHIPFVFYTATYTSSKDEKFALNLGAERFLIKPMETQKLVKVLEEVLDQHGQPSKHEEANNYLQQYNDVLFNKLDRKVTQLEKTNLTLQEEIVGRKKVEIALRASEQQYSLLFNKMSDGFALYEIIFDEDDIPLDYRFIKANPAFETIIGLRTSEVIGKTLSDLLPDFEAHYIKLLENVVLTAQSERFEIYISDLEKHFEIHAYQPDKNQLAILFFDTTERKKAEQVEYEYEQIKTRFQQEHEHNTLVQDIMSKLSHDLRTPLSIILTAKDVLRLYFDKITPEKREEKLNTIEHQVQFILELLDDMSWLVRRSPDEKRFAPKLINLATLCKVIAEDISPTYDNIYQVQFLNLSEEEFAFVDDTLVSRIVMNLLTNAIKYSPDNTDIHLEMDYSKHAVILRVIDNGMGISPEDLSHIFEVLYRVEASSHIDGNGMGLSIVKDCVERHQGAISVESEIGKGSTFTIELPLQAD